MDKIMDKISDMFENIKITPENEQIINEAKKYAENGNYEKALELIKKITERQNEIQEAEEEENKPVKMYPEELCNKELEEVYIGLLLNNPRLITKFYYPFEICLFEDQELLNIYKSVLFTEGGEYSSEKAKNGFNFSKDSEEVYILKNNLRDKIAEKKYDEEKIYTDLKKLFILRKGYRESPVEEAQEQIVGITKYELYNKMSVEEVESAISQVNDTRKFKRAILNENLTKFLEEGDNNLTNGLDLPFPTLTAVFKGIRKGETMAFAMPSNSGKSRFTINLAAHTAFVHNKKVLVISNEMSEEKMKLCLITTILNNKAFQEIHGQTVKISETELLEFKFRPDKDKNVEVDEDGYVLVKEGETRKEYIKRLFEVSTDFCKTIEVTNWVNKQIKNSIYFINITDHTNDELQKVIMNYYYKEKIEYVFYDTLKTDTANIGIDQELKKTATILSNLAQNFGMYICSTLQLDENNTLPVNLNVNDLAVSKTVKEVLDTLTLMKQINRDTLQNYEYSLNEVDTEFFELEKFEDPDVRYYSCVVDKNRAGAKPTLVFRLNLAYNVWEELGYLRLKQ